MAHIERIHAATSEGYSDLGRFISACATLEGQLTRTAFQMMGIDIEIADMLMGEDKNVGTLTTYVLRSAKRMQLPEATMTATDCLCQDIQYINRVRSWIAHKPLFEHGQYLTFSNELILRLQTKATVYACTRPQLRKLADFTMAAANLLPLLATHDPTFPKKVRAFRASPSKSQLPGDPKVRSPKKKAPKGQH